MLFALLACSSANLLNGAGDGAPTAQNEDTGSAGATSDTGMPVYWTLDASLDVVAGAPRTGSSVVSVSLLDASSHPLCTAVLEVTSAVTKASPDDAIYAWWLLTVADDDACDAGLATVLLGIGELNADVEAAIPAGGYDAAAASSFNGAYFGAGAETEWAFGIAWPVGGLGDGDDVEAPPIPDGNWLVEPLFPFPI
jgi:hypothetical protein